MLCGEKKTEGAAVVGQNAITTVLWRRCMPILRKWWSKVVPPGYIYKLVYKPRENTKAIDISMANLRYSAKKKKLSWLVDNPIEIDTKRLQD